jgi:hypothetical protein
MRIPGVAGTAWATVIALTLVLCGLGCGSSGAQRAGETLLVSRHRKCSGRVRRLREWGTAVLLVSHSLDQVFRLADRICVLRRGKEVRVPGHSDDEE